MTYRLICRNCGAIIEVVRPMKDAPVGKTDVHCPECGEFMHRQYSSVPVKYRAGGFYSTEERDRARKALNRKRGPQTKADAERERRIVGEEDYR